MVDFTTLANRMDDAVFAHLSDAATINGVAVRGMFRATWLQPEMGNFRTGLMEPALVVRNASAAGVQLNAQVTFAEKHYDVVSIEPDGTGLTALILRERLA